MRQHVALKRAPPAADLPFEAVFETVPTPLLVLVAGRVERANRAFYHTFRAAPADTVGLSLGELQNGRWAPPALLQLLAGKRPVPAAVEGFEVTHDFPSVGRRTLLVSTRPLEGGVGGDRVVVALDDVTDGRRAELERAAYAHELERANGALDEFARAASQELEVPLRRILAIGEGLQHPAGGALNPASREDLCGILSAATRMRALIGDLLLYSEIATRPRPRPLAPIDLSVIARQVLDDLAEQIAHTGAQVVVGDLPRLAADPAQIRQLLRRLIGNALKFHQPHRPPTVQVTGRLDDTGLSCELLVEDEGIGLEHRFDTTSLRPLGRLHGRTEDHGSGMGLAICWRIVERHGGRITAWTNSLGGASFLVTLPVRRSDPEAALELATAQSAGAVGMSMCPAIERQAAGAGAGLAHAPG
jgi:signal transduction histidine kinase